MSRARTIVIPAVYDRDLKALLERAGLYERVARGEAKCYFCGRRLGLSDIGAIITLNGELKLICDNPACLWKGVKLKESMKRASRPS